MKKRVFFALAAVMCFVMQGCDEVKEIFAFDDSISITVNVDTTNLPAGTSTVKVQSLSESIELGLDTATSVTLQVFRNGKPQIVAVTDADNHLLMMYRGPVTADGSITVNAHSTANALVTFNPLYGPVPSAEYNSMISIIEAAPQYQDYSAAVALAIGNGYDLADTNSAQLMAMLYNLLRSLSEQAFAGQETINNAANAANEVLACYPLIASASDSTLTLRTSANCPSFYGYLLDGNGVAVQEVAVTAAQRYAFMDNFGSSANPASYGVPTTLVLPADGLYTLSLSCSEESAIVDFYVRLVNNILASLGADVDPAIVSAITPYARRAVADMGIDIVHVSTADIMRVILRSYDAVVDYLRNQTDLFSNNEANWDLASGLLKRVLVGYNSLRSTTDALLRTTWRFTDGTPEATKDTTIDPNQIIVNFFYSASTGITPADRAILTLRSGNNQSAPAFATLTNALTVTLRCYDEQGAPQNHSGRQVRFVAENGNGVFANGLAATTVTTESDGVAFVHWTLGSGNSGNLQSCYAVAIDENGNEISNRVYFNALVSNTRYRVSLCCDWADHTNYAAQFDVDLTTVSDTGIVSLVPVSGAQWDYNGWSERYEMNGTLNTATKATDMTLAMYMGEYYGGWHFRTDQYQFVLQGSGFGVEGTLIYDGFDHGSPYGAGCGTYIWIEKLGSNNNTPAKTRRPSAAPAGKPSLVAQNRGI